MGRSLSSLEHKREREFWASCKTILNTKHGEVGLVRSKVGRFSYAQEEISIEFETTVYGGEHSKN